MAELRRVNLVIRGRVQGVGFRYFARKCADEFGVTGFVHNLPNGDVEVEAEGATESVEAFQLAVSKGPSTSLVKEVVNQDLPPLQNGGSFEVQ